jgi:hypothetical protein
MKPQTYFRIALLTPYILWGIGLLVMLALSAMENELSETWNFILMPIAFYTIGIILWFVPYTILAIGLGIWSGNKSITALRSAALAAPFLFFALMTIEIIIVNLPPATIAEFLSAIAEQSLAFGVFSLLYGYLCVGIAFGIFKFLQRKNLIAIEVPPSLPET